MNLESSPKCDELRQLLLKGDDRSGNHVLWVDSSASVHLSSLPFGVSPVEFSRSQKTMKLRIETFSSGHGLVGPSAADDDVWVNRLFSAIVRCWPHAKSASDVFYCDDF